VHLVFAGPAALERLAQLAAVKADRETIVVARLSGSEDVPFCSTADPNVAAAFAIYRGSDAIDGTEFLIDPSGWLRAIWFPGRKPDWREPDVLAREVAAVRDTAASPRAPAPGHAHSH